MATTSDVVAAPAPSVTTSTIRPERDGVTTEGRVIAACVVGLGTALSGFPPLNNVPALLHIGALPGFSLITPAVLVSILALWMSRGSSHAGGVPLVAAAPLALVTLGACLSLTASPHLTASAATLILAILAPSGLFLSVRRGKLPPAMLAGSFLTGLTLALLRADLVFLEQTGFPTPAKLYDAKFTSRAYDFHYYTLGNPDHTATFLLLPLTLALGWSLVASASRRTVWLLRGCAGVICLTMLLTYGRFPLLVAGVLVLLAVLRSGLALRLRMGIVALAIGGAVALALASPSHYLTELFSTTPTSSGTVRVNSLRAGLDALMRAPLTGAGLGQYGLGAPPPAHSSIVQAGAEMGIAGFAGVMLLTLTLVAGTIGHMYRRAGFTLRSAALGAATLYACATAAAGPGEGLFVGLISIYGLALALLAGIGCGPEATAGYMSLAEARPRLVARFRLRPAGRRSGRRVAWLAYGFAWAPVGALLTVSRLPDKPALSESRLRALHEVIVAHHHGFGPLVEMLGPNSFFPAGPTDDQGGYLVTPWLSDLLHTNSVNSLIRAAFLVGMCVLLALYPIAIRRLTGSRVAALAAPVLVLAFFSFMPDDGFYWVPAVSLALCAPWLLAFVRERVAPPGPLIAVSAVAGITQLFRSQTGLGLLLGAVAACMLASEPRTRKALTIAAIALAYVSFGSGTLNLALQSRASRMRAEPLATLGEAGITSWADPGSHPLWHTAYIGLGVVPNRYGITYSDSTAQAYVRSVDAAAAYAGPEYESILRSRVLHLLVTDPGFVVRAEKRKLGAVLADGLSRFWALLLMLPVAVGLGMGRRSRWRYAAIGTPLTAIAILPSLIAIPIANYEMPWLGLLATVGVLCGCWLVGRAGAWATAPDSALRRHPLAEPASHAYSRWRASWETRYLAVWHRCDDVVHRIAIEGRRLLVTLRLAVTGVGPMLSGIRSRHSPVAVLRSRAVYVVVAVVLGGFIARWYLDTWRGSVTRPQGAAISRVATLPVDAELNDPIRAWRLGVLPTGWTVEPGTRAMRGVALTVATTPIRNGYQLQSPTLRLAAGDYVVAVRGEIRSGGLAVGILDVAANRWLSVTSYSRTADPRPATMTTEVHLSTPRRVAIILSNGPTDGKRSDWLLSQASIASKSAPLVANPLPISSRLVDANHHWRLGSIPSGWTVVSGTRVRTGRNLSVSTTPANNAYQLESPRFVLPAGRYRAAIEGELRSGGIELGVLDTAADRWVNITSYGSTVPPEPTVMVDEFSLAAPRRVQLILSNLSTSGTPSSWLLSQALIAPQSRTTASPHGLALPALAGSGRSSSRR